MDEYELRKNKRVSLEFQTPTNPHKPSDQHILYKEQSFQGYLCNHYCHLNKAKGTVSVHAFIWEIKSRPELDRQQMLLFKAFSPSLHLFICTRLHTSCRWAGGECGDVLAPYLLFASCPGSRISSQNQRSQSQS